MINLTNFGIFLSNKLRVAQKKCSFRRNERQSLRNIFSGTPSTTNFRVKVCYYNEKNDINSIKSILHFQKSMWCQVSNIVNCSFADTIERGILQNITWSMATATDWNLSWLYAFYHDRTWWTMMEKWRREESKKIFEWWVTEWVRKVTQIQQQASAVTLIGRDGNEILRKLGQELSFYSPVNNKHDNLRIVWVVDDWNWFPT